MTAAQTNIVLIYMIDVIIETSETVHSQNIKLYDNDNNSDDTDKKYIDSDSCNLLDMLTAFMKM